MKTLFAFLLLASSITVFSQERVGIEAGTRYSTDSKGDVYDQDLVAGLIVDNANFNGGLRLIIPINSQLTKDQFEQNIAENPCGTDSTVLAAYNGSGECQAVRDKDGKRYFGTEFLGLYKIHDRLGIGGVAGVYFVDDLNGVQGILGPAAKVKIIDAERFDASVEGRYNVATQRWEVGGSLLLGPKTQE